MNNGPHWMFAPLGALLLLPALIELAPLIARVRTVWIWRRRGRSGPDRLGGGGADAGL